MSLDIYLIKKGQVTYDEGKTFEDFEETVFDINTTHNLAEMASNCGLYPWTFAECLRMLPDGCLEINGHEFKTIIEI